MPIRTNDKHDSGRSRLNNLTKVHFPLSREDASFGVDAENLWAEEITPGVFRIDNIPFYVYSVSYEDTVTAVLVNGRLEFKAVVNRAGHSMYRVLVSDPEGFESDRYARLWRRLADLGCSCEIAKRQWIAIDVPASTDPDEAYAVLELGKIGGVWSLDEGHCGHPM